jgi:hypothetical protein
VGARPYWLRALVAIAVVWLDKRLLAAAELCRCATRGRNAAARVGLALLWIGDQGGRLARRLLVYF